MELVEGQTPAKTLRPVRSRSSELALARRIAEALEAAHEKGIEVGVILGTASYMSPDQARGLPADHRSDIASVLAREADLASLPPDLAPRLSELLKGCLEKHPKRRWQGDRRFLGLLPAGAAVISRCRATANRTTTPGRMLRRP
jgi:serine/threonine protein kinase